SYTYFGVVPNTRKQRLNLKKQWKALVKEHQATDAANAAHMQEVFPRIQYGAGGPNRRHALRGTKRIRVQKIPTSAHAAATSFPYVAGPSLGADGVYIGTDQHGGGAFFFYPLELFAVDAFSGMSRMLFGTVGTGK